MACIFHVPIAMLSIRQRKFEKFYSIAWYQHVYLESSHLVESITDLCGWKWCSESQKICYIIWLFNPWGSWPPQIPDQTQYLDNSPFKRVIKSVKAVCNTSPAFSALQLLVRGHLDCYDKNRIAIELIQIQEPCPNLKGETKWGLHYKY